ncbi:MAG TPA: cell division protein ZapB [Bryobacteraceae bacterium]|nr:cell division protein ZapB [Bryobacteraceae bacterium]
MSGTGRTLIDSDVLAGLEDRILRAVDLIGRLKREKEVAEGRVRELSTGQSSAAETLKAENARLRAEVETLRAERQDVRARIERLLGQLDALD